jgi:hypothetical protein
MVPWWSLYWETRSMFKKAGRTGMPSDLESFNKVQRRYKSSVRHSKQESYRSSVRKSITF